LTQNCLSALDPRPKNSPGVVVNALTAVVIIYDGVSAKEAVSTRVG